MYLYFFFNFCSSGQKLPSDPAYSAMISHLQLLLKFSSTHSTCMDFSPQNQDMVTGICTLIQGETLDPSAHFRTLEHSEGLGFLSCLPGEKDLSLGSCQSPFSLISQVLASAHDNLHSQQSFGKQAAGLPAEDNRGE